MFENKKNLRAFIVLTVIMLALIVNGIFTLGSTRNNPETAWSTLPGKYSNESGYIDDYVVLKVSDEIDGEAISTSGVDGSGSLTKVWLNVGKITDDNTEDGFAVISIWPKSSDTFDDSPLASSVTTAKIKKGVDAKNEQYQYNWYMVEVNKYFDYWKIYTKDTIQINEIVFTNKDNVILPVEIQGANQWVSETKMDYVLKDNLPEDASAFNLIDEQNMLKKDTPLTKKYNFTTLESNVVNAALSIGNQDGYFVDNNSGALGAELAFLGLAVFGINPLGVRIIPYLFYMLTICLLFALGKRIFADSDAGLLFAVIYTLLGLGLSVGSTGLVVTIGVFFAVLSVYFAHMYYSMISNYAFDKKHTFKAGSTKILAPVLLSSIAFALGFCVDSSVVFVLPVLIAIAVLGIIKSKKVYAYNDKIAEYEDEKVRNSKQYKTNAIGAPIVLFASMILFTLMFAILFYGIAGNVYIKYYNTANLLNAIFAHVDSSLFGHAGTKGEFIKWIVAGGSTVIFNGSSTAIYNGMNVAVQLIALISFILLTVYVIKNLVKKPTNKEVRKQFKAIAIPYCILAAGFIFSWLPYAFVGGAVVTNYLMASLFIVGFIPLGLKCFKYSDAPVGASGKVMKSTIYFAVVVGLALLFFALGYVMFAGIEVSGIVAKILYGWWVY